MKLSAHPLSEQYVKNIFLKTTGREVLSFFSTSFSFLTRLCFIYTPKAMI